MRNVFLLIVLACLPLLTHAQYPLVTIEDIQRPSQDSLAACIDRSPFLDDTVRVRGVVVVKGGLAYSADGRQVWIQAGNGPWSGLDVRYGGDDPTSPTDMWDLTVGDSVEITGVVERFGAETQINPLESGVEVLDFGRPVSYSNVDIGELNDNTLTNQLETGEQWEGQYIEITDVTVISVSTPFAGNRQNFIVQDASGNQIQISDRFPAGRSIASTGNNNQNDDPGELVIPPPGTTFDTIRGLVFHTYPNGCATTGNLAFGYELHPFKSEDLDIGKSAPLISGVTRTPLNPSETETTTVQANIIDPDGNITNALLYYSIGLGSTNFIAVPMNDIGGIYQAEIPASAYNNGEYVQYYISATDDSSLTNTFPFQGEDNPLFYAIRPDGTTVYDVQFTPYSSGISPYRGQVVTVKGIITATSQPGDLGYVYLQQPGEDRWSGLALIQNSDLNNLQRGDEVEVTGLINESFGLTVMEVNNVSITNISQPIPTPTVVNPDSFTTRTNFSESFEGVLVQLTNPSGSGIYVVDDNPDDNGSGTPNFAEYFVGSSLLTDTRGCRVLAGRQTGSAFSSLNVSYINDSTWAFNDGEMAAGFPLCVVSIGDSMSSLTGIITYSFGEMKLLPRNNDDFEAYSGENCPSGTVSVPELTATDHLGIYPNPAQAALTVSHVVAQPRTLYVDLLDLMGRRLFTQEVSAGQDQSTLSLEGLSSGLYLVRVRDAQQVLMTEKLQVNR